MSGMSFDSSDDDDDNDDDDASVMSGMSDVSGMSTNSMFSVGMNQALKQPTVLGEISPVVQHRITQLLTYEYFILLDLTSVDLSPTIDLDALGDALRQTKTLETIILDQCCLDDNCVEKLAGSIEESSGQLTHQLKKLSLSQNKIGNRGIQALEFLFRTSPTLEELSKFYQFLFFVFLVFGPLDSELAICKVHPLLSSPSYVLFVCLSFCVFFF